MKIFKVLKKLILVKIKSDFNYLDKLLFWLNLVLKILDLSKSLIS